MACPADGEELAALLALARGTETPFFLLGNGTNLLCADAGWDGLVISTRLLQGVSVDGDRVTAEAGTLLSRTAAAAMEAGLTGLEFAHGIPGSVGGAVAMNAGAYGGEIADAAEETAVVRPDGTTELLRGEAHRFSYRHSAVSEAPGTVVLRTVFRLAPGERDGIAAKMRELAARRRASQPLELPSAGSVFKRPEGHFVGPMVEACGLKGRRVGGAAVSEKHAGFIVNLGGASAADVLALIEVIRAEVFARFGVALTCEIRPLGLGREAI